MRCRLSAIDETVTSPFGQKEFGGVLEKRRKECDNFYKSVIPGEFWFGSSVFTLIYSRFKQQNSSSCTFLQAGNCYATTTSQETRQFQGVAEFSYIFNSEPVICSSYNIVSQHSFTF